MKKIPIADNLYQYQFPPHPGKHFGFNIFALIHGPEALWIDAGFENHALAVQADLALSGCTPKHIILSHFHDDHMFGLKALSNVTVFGSGLYQTTLDLYTPPEEQHFFRPSRILTSTSTLQFGAFNLTFLVMPGHAVCNVYTIINDRFIHVGDDIMFSNEGAPLLPSVELERVHDHITSLGKLKEFKSYTFLLGHGNLLKGEALIQNAIDNRLAYLKAVFESKERISYQAAVRHCACDFLHAEWHDDLYGGVG